MSGGAFGRAAWDLSPALEGAVLEDLERLIAHLRAHAPACSAIEELERTLGELLALEGALRAFDDDRARRDLRVTIDRHASGDDGLEQLLESVRIFEADRKQKVLKNLVDTTLENIRDLEADRGQSLKDIIKDALESVQVFDADRKQSMQNDRRETTTPPESLATRAPAVPGERAGDPPPRIPIHWLRSWSQREALVHGERLEAWALQQSDPVQTIGELAGFHRPTAIWAAAAMASFVVDSVWAVRSGSSHEETALAAVRQWLSGGATTLQLELLLRVGCVHLGMLPQVNLFDGERAAFRHMLEMIEMLLSACRHSHAESSRVQLRGCAAAGLEALLAAHTHDLHVMAEKPFEPDEREALVKALARRMTTAAAIAIPAGIVTLHDLQVLKRDRSAG